MTKIKETRQQRADRVRKLVIDLIGKVPTLQLKNQICKETGYGRAAVGDMIRAARKKAGIYKKQPKFVEVLPDTEQ